MSYGLIGRNGHGLSACVVCSQAPRDELGAIDPEDCLSSLAAEALRHAHPDRPLFPSSLGLMAVANAFVMLGPLPEPRAEAILAEHRDALEREGFGTTSEVTMGELTVRPGAHEYWESRSRRAA